MTRIDAMITGKKDGRIAPHKPLYLLLCIADLQKGRPRLRAFSHLRKELADALRLFTSGKQLHPEYPFSRLPNDRLAVLVSTEVMEARKSNSDPTVSELLKKHARGGLREEDHVFLKQHPRAQSTVIQFILQKFFPKGAHADILNFFQLSIFSNDQAEGEADLGFRKAVLDAYNNSCAVSGASVLYGSKVIGVEAVPICWTDRPQECTAKDGLALSVFFARLFDLGLISVGEHFEILVSNRAQLAGGLGNELDRLQGSRIRLPPNNKEHPSQEKLDWHRKWLFKE